MGIKSENLADAVRDGLAELAAELDALADAVREGIERVDAFVADEE